ncbi:MAG: hypothetical protein OXC60_19440 [Litoreibacter sp.]|nr:hypothetical protein [Litoreibacter sp.]
MTHQDALTYADRNAIEFAPGATQNDQDVMWPPSWYLLPLVVLGFCAWWCILSALFF